MHKLILTNSDSHHPRNASKKTNHAKLNWSYGLMSEPPSPARLLALKMVEYSISFAGPSKNRDSLRLRRGTQEIKWD